MMSMGGTAGLSPRSATWQNSTRNAVRTSAGIRTESALANMATNRSVHCPVGAPAEATHAGEHFVGVIQGIFKAAPDRAHKSAAWPAVPGRGG